VLKRKTVQQLGKRSVIYVLSRSWEKVSDMPESGM